MDRLFTLTDPKPSYAEGFVNIGLTTWLGSEEISSVAFTAINFNSKQNETASVIDISQCTYTETIIQPFIKGGVHGETYLVTMKVVTDATPATKEEFYLKFTVNDNIPKLPNY